MRAEAVTLLEIFGKKMRLEVPLFQRQYVWNKEKHWEPLWEDISRKFSEYLEGRIDAPVHFLGAMVLDQKQTPTTHVEKRQIIDGQQRLTTLQIFLAAFRDFSLEKGHEALAKECEGFTINMGMMTNPDVDKFKVWPTQLDQDQFADVVLLGSRIVMEKKYPPRFRKFTRKLESRPRMVEAYFFFFEELDEFFVGTSNDSPLSPEVPLEQRLEECFNALKNALKVVVIDLDQDDDAQVIFETLNARGEPLLPFDLVRNYIFLRAARRGESQEVLYNKYWRKFDDPFWRKEVKQGRLLRPRSDLLLQHYLASRQFVDIPVKHLFVEYKFWVEKQKNFSTVEEELTILSHQGDGFRRILEPKEGDPLKELVTFLDIFDVRTSYPLLLSMLDAEIDDQCWKSITTTLESYLLRRAVCGLTTKNYNRIFLALTRNIRRDGVTPENLSRQLADQSGGSSEWPSDAAFGEAWRSRHIYQILNNPKIVYVLKRLNDTFYGSKMEAVIIKNELTVEHILPQAWVEHWPLLDGNKGMTEIELSKADPIDPRAIATRKRNEMLQTIGNLTILTQGLNSAASNSAWINKKPDLLRHSLLPINQQLNNKDSWDEATILERGETLLERAVKLWPRI